MNIALSSARLKREISRDSLGRTLIARVRSGATSERLLDKPAWYPVALENPKVHLLALRNSLSPVKVLSPNPLLSF